MEPTDPVVRVVIPAHPRYLRIARLTAAGVAGDLGFGLGDIEDLRVAIDEMSAVLIESADDAAELELTYRVVGDELQVEGRCPAPGASDGALVELHPVARELLAMTADEFDLRSADGWRTFRLCKRRSDLRV